MEFLNSRFPSVFSRKNVFQTENCNSNIQEDCRSVFPVRKIESQDAEFAEVTEKWFE